MLSPSPSRSLAAAAGLLAEWIRLRNRALKAMPKLCNPAKNSFHQDSRGQFFKSFFLRLREKLAPTLLLDLALFVPRRKVCAYASFKKLASENGS
jgi:hypothetical protein